jgi:integrase
MPHFPAPWKRKNRGWYVELPEGQIKLAPVGASFEDAMAAYHELMGKRAQEPTVPAGAILVKVLLDEYLKFVKANKKPETFETSRQRLQSFLDYLASKHLKDTLTVEQIKPFHVREWADSHEDWSPTSKRGRMGIVKAAFNWAAEEVRIEYSPIATLKMPAAESRELCLKPDEYEAVLVKVTNKQFRELLEVAWETGARPQELKRVEARHYDNGTWVFKKSEGKKKRSRQIFLNDRIRPRIEQLNERYCSGPILRNEDGNLWTNYSVNCNFVRLEKKIGQKLHLGCFRHSWCTRALKVLDPVATSVLMGHADPSMLARVYQHLNQDADYLRAAANKVSSND